MYLRVMAGLFLCYGIGFSQPHGIDKNVYRDKNPVLFQEKAPFSHQVNEFVSLVHTDSLTKTLQYLDKKGIRYQLTVLNEVRDWISSQLKAYGYSVAVQDVTSCGQNIIIEKNGTKYPDKYIVICAHYDSISGGAGINDNGTGAIILLEIARVLQKAESEYSIILVWFVGEERGMVGSSAYVNKISSENKNIVVNFNLDEVGGVSNQTMTTLTCERDMGNSVSTNDAASKLYTDTLAMVTNTYTTLKSNLDKAWGSDYLSFEKKGYVITGYYEKVPGGNPFYHTANDVLKNLSIPYVKEVAKGSVAFTVSIARCQMVTPVAVVPVHAATEPFSLAAAHAGHGTNRIDINYRLAEPASVRFSVFTLEGKNICWVNAGLQNAGNHVYYIDVNSLSSQALVFVPIINEKALHPERIYITR